MKRTGLIVFLCSATLGLIVSQLNHSLAPYHVSIFVSGLLVVFPALRLRYREGAWAVFATGLVFDAATPVPFGLHGLVMLAAHSAIFFIRDRLPREESLIGLFIAILANLGVFLVISIYVIVKAPLIIGAWPRLSVDLLISQGVIALISPWFFAFQEHALAIGGINLRPEQRGRF